jgi:DNA replication protein DnaC
MQTLTKPNPTHVRLRQATVYAEQLFMFAAVVCAGYLLYKHFPMELLSTVSSWVGTEKPFTTIMTILGGLVGLVLLWVLIFVAAHYFYFIVPPLVIAYVPSVGWKSALFILFMLACVYMNHLAMGLRWTPQPAKKSEMTLESTHWSLAILKVAFASAPLQFYRGNDYEVVAVCFACFAVAQLLIALEVIGLPDGHTETKDVNVGAPAMGWSDASSNNESSHNENQPLASSAKASERQEFMARFPAKPSSLTFADVVGMDAFKARLLAAGKEATDGFREPAPPPQKKLFGNTAQATTQTAPTPSKKRNGILLFGEPGNGKTMMAEALAGELNLPIITVTYGDLASRYVNQTTEVVAAAFDAAEKAAPCVLFVDEIDSLLRKRDSLNASFEHTQTVNTLLTRMVEYS